MKTIYNVKALCVVALLGTTATISAQEDTSKKQNLEREMTLEREYDPTVQDASKVNTLPVIKEPEVKKMPIDYANFTIAADPAKEISLLPPGNIMTDIQYNKRRGYFNFGGGTYLNLNGDLGYHILSTDKDQLNIWFSHRSTNGKVKYLQVDEKVKAKLNDNMGGLNFKHNFDKLALKMGVKYGYSGFNYYGLPIESLTPITSSNPTLPAADMETNQVAQTIKANVGVESKADAPVGYLLDLSYTNFSYKYGYSKEHDAPSEGTFNLDFGLSSGFGGNQRVGLNGNFQYFNYSLPSELKSPETKDPSTYFDNFAAATLNPYYKIEGDNWHVKLGVNAMFFSGEQKKFMASPNISADVEVADKTVLYLNADGKLQSNSMYDVNRINRYANPLERLTPSRNWLDGILGIKSGVAPGFWFDVFGGYKIVSNNYFFVPTLAYGDKDYFGSACGMMNEIDTKQLLVGANLKYSYQQLFEISLKGVYNNWTAEYSDKYSETNLAGKDATAWGMPEMEITAGVTVRPINNLSASLDYYLATGREARLGEKNVKMDNINELNLTGAYNINDTFGLYLKLNNVLFQKYELYYGYPLQKFSAMIGVNINF